MYLDPVFDDPLPDISIPERELPYHGEVPDGYRLSERRVIVCKCGAEPRRGSARCTSCKKILPIKPETVVRQHLEHLDADFYNTLTEAIGAIDRISHTINDVLRDRQKTTTLLDRLRMVRIVSNETPRIAYRNIIKVQVAGYPTIFCKDHPVDIKHFYSSTGKNSSMGSCYLPFEGMAIQTDGGPWFIKTQSVYDHVATDKIQGIPAAELERFVNLEYLLVSYILGGAFWDMKFRDVEAAFRKSRETAHPDFVAMVQEGGLRMKSPSDVAFYSVYTVRKLFEHMHRVNPIFVAELRQLKRDIAFPDEWKILELDLNKDSEMAVNRWMGRDNIFGIYLNSVTGDLLGEQYIYDLIANAAGGCERNWLQPS